MGSVTKPLPLNEWITRTHRMRKMGKHGVIWQPLRNVWRSWRDRKGHQSMHRNCAAVSNTRLSEGHLKLSCHQWRPSERLVSQIHVEEGEGCHCSFFGRFESSSGSHISRCLLYIDHCGMVSWSNKDQKSKLEMNMQCSLTTATMNAATPKTLSVRRNDCVKNPEKKDTT